ncbi:MAG: hypothetical protein ACPGU1_14100 [Myxococcota bacterium]
MVSLNRVSLVLLLSIGAVAGCATIERSPQDLRIDTLCKLTQVSGRLNVVPAGPGSIGVRIVTLDRAEALAEIDAMDNSEALGIAKIRVESPRPLLAIILRLEETNPAISAALAWTPVPISIAVLSEHPELEELTQWAETQAVPLLILNSRDDALPPKFRAVEGVDVRGAKDLQSLLLKAVQRAEHHGAAWIHGTLNRPTLEAVHTLISQHGDAVHVVGFEHITRPPTTPRWRRRCASESD